MKNTGKASKVLVFVLLSLFLTSLTAYSVDKLAWKGKKSVMALITVGMFMPGQVLICPCTRSSSP